MSSSQQPCLIYTNDLLLTHLPALPCLLQCHLPKAQASSMHALALRTSLLPCLKQPRHPGRPLRFPMAWKGLAFQLFSPNGLLTSFNSVPQRHSHACLQMLTHTHSLTSFLQLTLIQCLLVLGSVLSALSVASSIIIVQTCCIFLPFWCLAYIPEA